eukprot:XP_001698321.1 predicted protein [Chlamydomonas reinhardtii]
MTTCASQLASRRLILHFYFTMVLSSITARPVSMQLNGSSSLIPSSTACHQSITKASQAAPWPCRVKPASSGSIPPRTGCPSAPSVTAHTRFFAAQNGTQTCQCLRLSPRE